ncbi:hypothetical protein EN45_001920 [Penicillium chrysogenum]|uniref:DUF6594 domain-containing protein n=1 Tax=Penicillium chrysogenum TaxID=5076 RepID=A0A167V6Z0_PENCH|nr:hypothetical protein EN45_001920 [Penicillium chrysogenum]
MWLLEWLPLRWKRAAPESIETGPPPPKQGRWEKVLEDLPSGYPSFSAFLATSNSSQVYRRFTNLRSRVLLAKQDRLSVLEDKLEALGKAEDRPIFLGSCRIDQNQERKQVLLEIDLALSSYGKPFSATVLACIR